MLPAETKEPRSYRQPDHAVNDQDPEHRPPAESERDPRDGGGRESRHQPGPEEPVAERPEWSAERSAKPVHLRRRHAIDFGAGFRANGRGSEVRVRVEEGRRASERLPITRSVAGER